MPFIPVPPTGTFTEKVDEMVADMIADPLFFISPSLDDVAFAALQEWVNIQLAEDFWSSFVTWTPHSGYRFNAQAIYD